MCSTITHMHTHFNPVVSMSMSVTCAFDIYQKECHHISAEFSTLVCALGCLLQQCTDINILKTFLRCYCHPLYPEKLYIEPHIYSNAKTASDILLNLIPTYINFMDHHLLREIVDRFGNEECKSHYGKYEQNFRKFVKKLRHHPAPVTDNGIEQCTSQKRLKVYVDDDVNKTTPQTVQTLQNAIMQATGIGQTGLALASQCVGNSVVFNFLIPHSCAELFSELCDHDLTILAMAGITKIEVEELVITVTKKHTTKPRKALSFTAQTAKELVKPSSIEYYVMERHDISDQQRSDLITKVKKISDSQLNEVCKEELLLEVSSFIEDWKTLAPFLGVQEIHYEQFTYKYPDINDQKYELLLIWKRLAGSSAKYCHLLETITLHGSLQEMNKLVALALTG